MEPKMLCRRASLSRRASSARLRVEARHRVHLHPAVLAIRSRYADDHLAHRLADQDGPDAGALGQRQLRAILARDLPDGLVRVAPGQRLHRAAQDGPRRAVGLADLAVRALDEHARRHRIVEGPQPLVGLLQLGGALGHGALERVAGRAQLGRHLTVRLDLGGQASVLLLDLSELYAQARGRAPRIGQPAEQPAQIWRHPAASPNLVVDRLLDALVYSDSAPGAARGRCRGEIGWPAVFMAGCGTGARPAGLAREK
jgi:hypothetical protein